MRGSAPRELYFVQEYCAGGSLGDLVRRQMVRPYKRQHPSDADALRWCLHIASALQYLHGGLSAVIHRDLKLDNVMLSCADVALADAKLADFGLARLAAAEDRRTLCQIKRMLAEDTADPAAATQAADSKSMLETDSCWDSSGAPAFVPAAELTGRTGSFGYMAPEVLHSRQYDAAVDIFSLGMCMHNLFARTIPSFSILLTGGEEQLELFAAQVADGYRPPLPAGLPAALADVINACWKGDPDLRPTARQVVQMLQAVRDSGELEGSDGVDATQRKQGCGCSIM